MKIKLLLILLLPILGFSQTQIGQDIDGELAGDLFGESVSISSNGNIVAISSRFDFDVTPSAGFVKVFENIAGTWTQIGSVIDGESNTGNGTGTDVSLSSNGNIVAIGVRGNPALGFNTGHVRIFENLSGVWTQIGQDINGEASGDFSGTSVSISSDGSIVAIGASDNDGNGDASGHVRIFENIGNVWTQIGQDIDGEASVDLSGNSVSLSSDGNIVAIGAVWNDGSGDNSGHVRIYENIGNVWTQIGQDIDGELAEDLFGGSVSLSSNGNIVAIGTVWNDENGDDSGHVRVYQNFIGTWTQIGQDIDGEAEFIGLGRSVSLNTDGSIIAVGASNFTRVYKNISNTWIQISTDINGEDIGDNFGFSVSLSDNGSVVAIGGLTNDGNGNNAGHVRVYDLSLVLSSDDFVLSQFSVFPNPAKDEIYIQLQKGLELENINIYNNLGQFISSTKNLQVNTSQLSSGLYFIEVVTNQGKATKKVVIE